MIKIDQQISLLNDNDSISILSLKQKKNNSAVYLENQKSKELLENSMIGKIGHFIEPVLAPLGFNWKMGVSLVAGIAAKEIVVSTLGVLHHAENTDNNSFNLADKLIIETNSSGKNIGKKSYTPALLY